MARAWQRLFGCVLLAASFTPSLAIAQCPPCGEPCPAFSSAPAFLDLVAMRGGAPEPIGAYTVIVRDACNAPLPGVPVTIDFTNCTDLVIASVQPASGMTVACTPPKVSGTTDANGAVTFTILGSAAGPGPTTGLDAGQVLVGASNTLLRNITVTAADINGINGLDVTDIIQVNRDIFSPGYAARSDLTHDGYITVADLIAIHSRLFQPGNGTGVSRCDGNNGVKLPVPNQGGGLDLAWNDCSTHGSSVATFACNTNTGSHDLVASMVAPQNITALLGVEVTIEVMSRDGSTLPSWWRLDNCRSTNISITPGAGTCPSIWAGSEPRNVRMTYPAGSPNRAIIDAFVVITAAPLSLTPDAEYELFRLLINHSNTVGGTVCPDCEDSVRVTLTSVKLLQDVVDDVLMTSPATSNVVQWQGPIGPPLSLSSISPNAAPATAPLTAEIRGAGFQAGATVRLVKTGEPDIVADSVTVSSDSSLTARFDLADKVVGPWDVVVTNPGPSTASMPAGFTVMTPYYTIPAAYANRSNLGGRTIRLVARTAGPSDPLLVHDYFRCMQSREMPDTQVVTLIGSVPAEAPGTTVLATGVLGEDPAELATQNLTFYVTGYTVLISGLPGAKLQPDLGTGIPQIQADCDSCKFAVLISGGIDRIANWKGFWEDLVKAYNFVKAQRVCDANIKVFYYDGVPRDGRIPAGLVVPAAAGAIDAHFATVRAGVQTCTNNGKTPALWVIGTDHGTSDGSLSLKRPFPDALPERYRASQLKDALQPILAAGLVRLDVRLAQCFAGQTLEVLEGLSAFGGHIRIATASGRNDLSWFDLANGSVWLQQALMGDGAEEVLRAANAAYDVEVQTIINQQLAKLAALDATIVAVLDPLLRAALVQLRPAAVMSLADAQSSLGKQRYFRSVLLTRNCEWFFLQVTPGGKIELTFIGNRFSCGNTTVWEKQPVVPARWIKKAIWWWNVPGSAGFRPIHNPRRIVSPANGTGIYYVHNDDGRFRIQARSSNPLGTLAGASSARVLGESDSESNPELFAGFSVGGADSSSAEFGDVTSPLAQVTEGLGLDLGDLPRALGGGGAGGIQVTFPIERQNQWWDDTEVMITALSGSGTLRVQCDGAQFGDVTLPMPGPGEYTAHLGAIAGTGNHTLTLSSLSGSVELDVWTLRTLVPIPDPETIIDYSLSPLVINGTHYVHTENTCAAEEAVDHVPVDGCADPASFMSGRDVIYTFSLIQPATITLDALGAGNADEQLMVFTSIVDPFGSCVAASDREAGGPGSEHLSSLNLGPGNYFVSTSLADAGCGDVTLTVDSSYPLDVVGRMPLGVTFHPSAPNPFREETTLSFDLPRENDVKIELFDLVGHRVRTITHRRWPAGSHQLVLSSQGLASGVYLCRMEVNGQRFTRRIHLVR